MKLDDKLVPHLIGLIHYSTKDRALRVTSPRSMTCLNIKCLNPIL